MGPQRIVCLTEEPTETLYALGEQHRIVGISGFTVRPAIARKEKPKVSAFTSAKIGEILKLQPDLAIGFSDIQADIAAELVRRGVEVWISNHRSVDGIVDYVRRLGALVGAAARANDYADALQRAGTADKEKAIAALESSTWADHFMPYGPTKFVNGQNTGGTGVLLQASTTDIDTVWPNQFASSKAVFPRPKLS